MNSICLMDFNFAIQEKGPARVASMSVAVTSDMKDDLKRIKESSERNNRLVNELTRQFWAQLIEKFDAGKIEDLASY